MNNEVGEDTTSEKSEVGLCFPSRSSIWENLTVKTSAELLIRSLP
jgi:hypothetical protein